MLHTLNINIHIRYTKLIKSEDSTKAIKILINSKITRAFRDLRTIIILWNILKIKEIIYHQLRLIS